MWIICNDLAAIRSNTYQQNFVFYFPPGAADLEDKVFMSSLARILSSTQQFDVKVRGSVYKVYR